VCVCAAARAALLQVNQLLEVGDRNAGMHKYTALDKWANQLRSIHTGVCNKVA
jgi:COP9 signalosome complex subunit 2